MHIGFFDSGIGGVSVAQSAIRDLPHYTYVYFADDTNMPYGNKSKDTLFDLTKKALEQMFAANCKLVVLACNSATTVLPRIQQEWLPKYYPNHKVLGVIRPTVEHMTEQKGQEDVYVLATAVTVSSKSFTHELSKIQKSLRFFEIPCPELAEAIEKSKNYEENTEIVSLCKKYLSTVPADKSVTIYTGCTHYAFVSDIIRRLRPRAKVFTQGNMVSPKLVQYLSRHPEIEKSLSRTMSAQLVTLCSSRNPDYIQKLKQALLFPFT